MHPSPLLEKLFFVGVLAPSITGGVRVRNQFFVQALREQGVGVKTFDTAAMLASRAAAVRSLTRELAGERQVVLSVSSKGRYTLIPLLYLRSRIQWRLRYVLLVVGGSLADEIRALPAPLRWAYLRALKRCDRLYLQTESLRRELASLGLKNLRQLPNPRPRPAVRWSERDPSAAPRRLLYLSRITETKGVTDLLDAVAQLRRQGRELDLDLYGPIDEDYRATFERLLGQHQDTRYRGIAEADDIGAVMVRYDALAFPSYWPSEGMPGVLIEAAMVGMPVVASDFPGSRELLDHEVSGLVTPARDVDGLARALERALFEPGLAGTIASGLREVSTRYEVGTIATEFLSDLRSMGWR